MTEHRPQFADVADGMAIAGLGIGTMICLPEYLDRIIKASKTGGLFPYIVTGLNAVAGGSYRLMIGYDPAFKASRWR